MVSSSLYLFVVFLAASSSASLAPRASPDAYACKVCPPVGTDAHGPYTFQTWFKYSTYVICQYYNPSTNYGKDCYYNVPSGTIQAQNSDTGCASALVAENYVCPAKTGQSGNFNGAGLSDNQQSVACAYSGLAKTCLYDESNGNLVTSGSDANCATKVGSKAPTCASLPSRRRRQVDNLVALEEKRRIRALSPPAPRAVPDVMHVRAALHARGGKKAAA